MNGGGLTQGNIHGVTSTDTIDFIHKYEVPDGKRVTYATYVVDYRPLKNEQYRVRITVGGIGLCIWTMQVHQLLT